MEEQPSMVNKFRAILKLGIIAGYFLAVLFLLAFGYSRYQLFLEQRSQKRTIVASYPYTHTEVTGYGRVKEPLVEMELAFPEGYRKTTFLLDSGAMISSLPMDTAKAMDVNLALLPRQSFRGFGNSVSYAYRGTMTLKIADSNVNVPVVFTENSGTKVLLGRLGFFDNYSVEFNHIKGTIDIYQ